MKLENLIPINPFTDEFVRKEIAFMRYAGEEPLDYRGLSIRFKAINGRCDDYLNKQMRFDDWKTPVMFIDGELWMSLSTMEVTSAFFGWWCMSGQCGMAGLGTGYTALRCAAEKAVDHLTVFERDQRVVDFFYHLHAETHAETLKKITIIVGDAREKCVGQEFDCFFADIYQTLLGDECITDIRHFLDNNDIGWYRFWGQEKLLLWAIRVEIIRFSDVSMIDMDYLRHWSASEGAELGDSYTDVEYTENAIRVMGSYPEQMYLDNGNLHDLDNEDVFDEEDYCYGN